MGVIRTGKDYRAAMKAVRAPMGCPACGCEAPDWRFQGLSLVPIIGAEDGLRVTVATCPHCGFVRQHLVERLEEEPW